MTQSLSLSKTNPPSLSKTNRWVVETSLWGAAAGVAGGLAEILWVGFYGAVSGNDTTELARGIVAVVGGLLPLSPSLTAPVALGIAIHMLAAIALGIALTFAWRSHLLRKLFGGDQYRFLPAALAAVWVFNFFVLLPLIDPYYADLHSSFTEILPYPVTLFSKLLFGLAAAAVLTRQARAQSPLTRVKGEQSCRAT